jgi:hypothetical protein
MEMVSDGTTYRTQISVYDIFRVEIRKALRDTDCLLMDDYFVAR